MRLLVKLAFVLAFNFLAACAVGPLVSHETARTVGDNNHELVGGYGQAGYVFKWNYGITDKFDIGLHWESLSIGVRVKYMFLGGGEGFSMAAAAGTGSSVGGSHYYGDLMSSWLIKRWEPYLTARFVHVKTDPVELRDKDTGHFNFTIPSVDYDYGQFIGGARFWMTPHWLLSLEASTLFGISSGFKVDNNLFAGAAFGYRW